MIYNGLFFLRVPRTGVEPALPCDNQILSLARLPIPPSRPMIKKSGCNIKNFLQQPVHILLPEIVFFHAQQICFGSNSFFIV
jgi:hypothetical protein